MTITVVLRADVVGENGTLWRRGDSKEASVPFADYLLRAELADYGSRLRQPRSTAGGFDLVSDRATAITVNSGPVWRDIIGAVHPKATGVGSPTRAAYAGGTVGQYSFVANDICDFEFHMPHDYASDPATDLYFHVHWSHNGTSISGNATFEAYFQYAKGHNQQAFTAEKMVTLSYATVDLATTPRYQHRIDEVVISGASDTASAIDRSTLEIDGLILVTLKPTSIPTIGGGGKLFVHTCDIHYQSTNLGTLNKAPNFYA